MIEQKLPNMGDYYAVCSYLLDKHGPVPDNYICNYEELANMSDEELASPSLGIYKNSGITRGKEGLWIHHVDENIIERASMTPKPITKTYILAQNKNQLVYATAAEHMKLHNLIYRSYLEGRCPALGIQGNIFFMFRDGVKHFTGEKLNAYYSTMDIVEFLCIMTEAKVLMQLDMSGSFLKKTGIPGAFIEQHVENCLKIKKLCQKGIET